MRRLVIPIVLLAAGCDTEPRLRMMECNRACAPRLVAQYEENGMGYVKCVCAEKFLPATDTKLEK